MQQLEAAARGRPSWATPDLELTANQPAEEKK
jgi:hypothetical protein